MRLTWSVWWWVRTVLACSIIGGGNLLADEPEAFVAKYCLSCHGENDKVEGGIDLAAFSEMRKEWLNSSPSVDIWEKRELWLRLIEQVDSEEMPPKKPLPTGEIREDFITSLRADLDAIDWDEVKKPLRQTVRRLTKNEYRNSMRDLLGIDLRAGDLLPEDGQGESGFSNDRGSLVITPNQMAEYFSSAERALEGVFAVYQPMNPVELEAERMDKSTSGMTSHLDGVVLVHPNHELQQEVFFPADGFYEFTIVGAVIGKPCEAEVRVDGLVVCRMPFDSQNLKSPRRKSARGFVKKGRHSLTLTSRNFVPHPYEPPDFVRIIDRRAKANAPRLSAFEEESAAAKQIRLGLNLKSTGVQECYEFLAAFGPKGDPRKVDQRRQYLDERLGQLKEIFGELSAVHGVSVKEIEERWNRENEERMASNQRIFDQVKAVRWDDWMKFQGKLYVDGIAVEGPVAHTTEKGTLAASLKNQDDPEAVVRSFISRAFRRPASEEEVDRYLQLLISAQRNGNDEDRSSALKSTLAAVLVSPDFLFRGQEGKPYELDSALSYFLWQSLPQPDLGEEEDLPTRIRQMIRSSRSDAFISHFAEEWLETGGLGTSLMPDPSRFPDFGPEIAEDMKEELRLFFTMMFRENRPVADLLESRVTFLNARLASFYGVKGQFDNQFRKTRWQVPERAGVLGKGAVLVSTSSSSRTNPARRGKWVLENLLGQTVGEPIADAGELPGNAGAARGMTLREEFAIHREQEVCARCHDRIDPIGLGLQNFDATGRWRDRESGQAIDASGIMPNGREFSSLSELLELIAANHRKDLIEQFAKKLFAVAKGQSTDYDREVERVVAGLSSDPKVSVMECLIAVCESLAQEY